jgi:hypothetical protein
MTDTNVPLPRKPRHIASGIVPFSRKDIVFAATASQQRLDYAG